MLVALVSVPADLLLVQTIANSPAGPAATVGRCWNPLVVVLTWNSVPSAGVLRSGGGRDDEAADRLEREG